MSKLPKPARPVTGTMTKKKAMKRLLFLTDGKVKPEETSSLRKILQALRRFQTSGGANE